jgi:hypothetical protein
LEADMRSDAARLSEHSERRSLQAHRCLVLNADFRPLRTYLSRGDLDEKAHCLAWNAPGS